MKLYYREFGSGPPLIILHGLYGSSDNWVTIAKKLADSFTVYLPDQRNHGQSPHSPVHDYNAMSDDLFELARLRRRGLYTESRRNAERELGYPVTGRFRTTH